MKNIILSSILVITTVFLLTILVFSHKSNTSMESQLKKIPSSDIRRSQVDGVLRKTPNACLVLGTGSMFPVIRKGKPTEVVAIVIFEPYNFELLEVGQLVLFDKVGQLIVHQLAMEDSGGWITSGSNNDGYDTGRVTPKSIRGAVIRIYNIED